MDDVSFSVGRGEVAALLGPNGSGKSTLMRCLIGFFSPTSGRVRLAGVDVDEDPVAARRRLGYLPEQVMLYPDLTVRRFLVFVAGVKGLTGGAVRNGIDDVLARCALAQVADRRTGTLSKGYRQRVGLAQALLGDPDVLVLDEPTVGLDPLQTVELRELVRGLGDGRTVLLSTHVLQEAAALCTRVVILARGRLVAEDTPAGLARRLEASGHVLVRVDGPPADVTAALAALAGVAGVEPLPPTGDAGHAFALRAADPGAVQRTVAAAVASRGWTLLEVRAVTPALEELFVRAVR